jgi:probable HAF family extracellular repeat protein
MRTRVPRIMAVLFVIIAFAISQPAYARKYALTDLGTLGGTESFAYAVNDSGDIVGYSRYPGDIASGPFLWSKGEMIDLNARYELGQGYYAGILENINNLGQIVGNSSDGHAVILSEGAITDLGTFGGAYASALGINNAGQAVGYFALPSGYHHAFLYSDGRMTELGPFADEAISVASAINDSGMIVGFATDSYTVSSRAFLYIDGVITDISPLDSRESYARDINNHGQVTGEYLPDGGPFHCFVRSEHLITDLGTLAGIDCTALAINDHGEVVGSSPAFVGTEIYCDPETGMCYEYPVYSWHGFLYKNKKMINLNRLIPRDSGWELIWAYDINNKGQIVGYGTVNGATSVYRAFLLSPVAETDIRIRPSRACNRINFRSRGKIPVAILSSEDFNAPSQVDQGSLTFGATGNETSFVSCARKAKDVNGDGLKDLVCKFSTNLAGFQCGDTEGILKAKTVDGMPIEGKNSVTIIPCKQTIF